MPTDTLRRFPGRYWSAATAPARAGYIGIDNRKAGRTAAWMIARASPQRLLAERVLPMSPV